MNCVIHTPKICHTADGNARLVAEIDFGSDAKEIWLEVDGKYGKYLCDERADAFLIALLPHAMRAGLDIECKAPVSERLKYQLETYLIPSLVKYGRSLHASTIIADTDSTPMHNAGGVGAGVSCGVDSLHILKNQLDSAYKSLKLTHLTINNVGAFADEGCNQYNWTVQRAMSLSVELGLEFVRTNSNLAEQLPIEFVRVHTYANVFAVYALQKLWKVFFYGSPGLDFQQYFSLSDNDLNDAAHYDLLSLDSFSTQNLKIYSEGGAKERYDKILELIDFEPANNYLQVCVSDSGPNCGRCFKCVRTLLMLDALGAVDKFNKVFDVAEYFINRHWYLQQLYWSHLTHADQMLERVYGRLCPDISLNDKILVYGRMVKSKFNSMLCNRG